MAGRSIISPDSCLSETPQLALADLDFLLVTDPAKVAQFYAAFFGDEVSVGAGQLCFLALFERMFCDFR
jgi:hypothetical protein